jgi:hypothetical protein
VLLLVGQAISAGELEVNLVLVKPGSSPRQRNEGFSSLWCLDAFFLNSQRQLQVSGV